ncbi:MAG TPA: acVLRF1 family peptidyl-tRNA hydrolase [Mycobacteriales bacterium]|nr:acVLRF1 family peptidyl-tRNA hydrolase [Mycobacteriales bacterium]
MTVSPERLARWLSGFEERHGPAAVEAGQDEVVHTAADGAVAAVEVPFPPLAGPLVEHVLRDRVVGVLLVRLGGHAAGVFEGTRLVASKVGSRNVQGRSAAGGWSQQRFARRRAGQAVVAHAAAADDAAKVLLGQDLDALLVGGDRNGVDAVLADRRLVHLQGLVTGRLLAVPDPRLKVLQEVPFRDVRIRVVEPPE